MFVIVVGFAFVFGVVLFKLCGEMDILGSGAKP